MKETKFNKSMYQMYGDSPDVRKWLSELNVKSKRNRKLRKELDDGCFGAISRTHLERSK